MTLIGLGRVFASRFLDRPIFVVGSGRSGTSVLLQALGEYPAVLCFRGEAPLISHIGGMVYALDFGDGRDYQRDALRMDKEAFYRSLRRLALEVIAGKSYGERGLLKELLFGRYNIATTRSWCAKTFASYRVASGLFQLFPKGKIVTIARNGCDVVRSMGKFHGFRDQAFEEHCQRWATSVASHVELAPMEGVLAVRHEELVASPKEFFRKVAQFLGYRDHPGPSEYVLGTVVHPLDGETQRGANVAETFARRRPAYEEWSEVQREVFKAICGEWMERLGYEVPF